MRKKREKDDFKNNDTTKNPTVKWRSTACLLFKNWLNYLVYQETSFELKVEELLKSLDAPDEKINKIWEEEANKRVDSYKKGNSEIVSEKDFFNILS